MHYCYGTIFYYYSIRFYQFYYTLALCAAIYPLLKHWIMSTPSILLFECIFRNLNSAILFTYICLFWDTVPFSPFLSFFLFLLLSLLLFHFNLREDLTKLVAILVITNFSSGSSYATLCTRGFLGSISSDGGPGAYGRERNTAKLLGS